MFIQFKIVYHFHEDENFKYMKMRSHVVLGQKKEQAWSLKKIIKLLFILKDVLFEDRL